MKAGVVLYKQQKESKSGSSDDLNAAERNARRSLSTLESTSRDGETSDASRTRQPAPAAGELEKGLGQDIGYRKTGFESESDHLARSVDRAPRYGDGPEEEVEWRQRGLSPSASFVRSVSRSASFAAHSSASSSAVTPRMAKSAGTLAKSFSRGRSLQRGSSSIRLSPSPSHSPSPSLFRSHSEPPIGRTPWGFKGKMSPEAKMGLASTAAAVAGAVVSNIHLQPPSVTFVVNGKEKGRGMAMQTHLGTGGVNGNLDLGNGGTVHFNKVTRPTSFGAASEHDPKHEMYHAKEP